MSQGILEILGYVTSSGAIAGFFGWFFGRRKYNEEVKNAEVNNFDAAIAAYKKMYEDMISEYQRKSEEQSKEIESLKEKLAVTEKQVLTLTNYILEQAMRGKSNIDNLKTIVDQDTQ